MNYKKFNSEIAYLTSCLQEMAKDFVSRSECISILS